MVRGKGLVSKCDPEPRLPLQLPATTPYIECVCLKLVFIMLTPRKNNLCSYLLLFGPIKKTKKILFNTGPLFPRILEPLATEYMT